MAIADFPVIDKLDKAWFFQETFLLANISMKIILKTFFLIIKNANIQFTIRKLTWMSYIYAIKKAPLTTYWIELKDQKEFIKMTLDENVKTFMVYKNYPSLKLKMIIQSA